jgi:hypothetical protein
MIESISSKASLYLNCLLIRERRKTIKVRELSKGKLTPGKSIPTE